jgi:CheY-like chemotaxis protein
MPLGTVMIPRQHFRILCVDDNDTVLELLADILGNSGYEVETAQNGFVALLKVNKGPDRLQLIITDLRMPGMDGFQLIEQSRTAGYSGPVIVYAASIGADARQRLRELRVSQIIEKPARAGDLIAAIRETQGGF